jgi:hypothetical protein
MTEPVRGDATATPDAAMRGRLFGVGFLAWIAMLGFDLFLHGGVLAAHYEQPSPFLLPLDQAFRLIPLGYLSFAFLAALLTWLSVRLGVRTWRGGALFGLALGAFIWGAHTVGLLSISTAEPSLMLGWFVGQTVSLGIAGGVVGSGLGGTPLRTLTWKVVVFAVIAVAASVVIQNVTGVSAHPGR